MRFIAALILLLTIAAPHASGAQEPAAADRTATGGSMTREDIMRRQRGEDVPSRERAADTASGAAAALRGQLGTRGATSDSELWEQLRFGKANVSASHDGAGAKILIQNSGMAWYEFRAGPLSKYGGYVLLGTLGLLLLYYLIRGPIRIEHGRCGITVVRFNLLERCGHWVLAVSFLVLGLTGLTTLFGRMAFRAIYGDDGSGTPHEIFATIVAASKWVHNWVAWPFMAALVIVFLMWVLRNIPNRHDVVWLLKAGGLLTKGVHPPAKKFNAGQKIIFWTVVLLGASISASGLSLLMPFEIPLFAKTFAVINATGAPGWFGAEPLPEQLTPHAEMQLASLWHTIVAFAMIAIILGHVYLGSIGMEGAFDAVGRGRVDLNWAREHHSLWVEEKEAEAARDAQATPAE